MNHPSNIYGQPPPLNPNRPTEEEKFKLQESINQRLGLICELLSQVYNRQTHEKVYFDQTNNRVKRI